jgi:imidazolonepropionase-like amidohydrolase/ABC-type multidrug transport system permease subunit
VRSYLALIRIDLKLAFRQRAVIFFNYLFPMIFFFVFAQALGAEQGGVINQVVTMTATIGILGNGLFGAGMRAVQEREMNILRRYKVTPISPAPILVASMVTGWILFMPLILMMLAIASLFYGMVLPARFGSLLIFTSIALVAFRAVGLILASTANSMAESNILTQLFYLPMLFLSGATFPASMFPAWLAVVAQFIPATYLVSGMQGILLRKETVADNWPAAAALVVTMLLGLFISMKLFRWEKEEKIRSSAKLWLVAVLLPFLVMGGYQAYSRENLGKAKILDRELRRSRTILIRNARIFVGDGKVIESGGVLVRNGRIAEVYEGNVPEASEVKAEAIEAAGKTLLPGLIDVHVHLIATGGLPSAPRDSKDFNFEKDMLRELAAYLYNGITSVKSAGDPLTTVLKVRTAIQSGEKLGAELFLCGPLFTTEGGHGTEYFKQLPTTMRTMAEREFVRLPKTPEEAREQVDALKRAGVDGIKAVLDAGAGGMVFNRLDASIVRAIADQAHADSLPIVVHTGDSHDVIDALSARVDGVEHGSFRDNIPEALFAQMKRQGTAYDPTLSVGEGLTQFAAGNAELLDRSLVQQVVPRALLDATKAALTSPDLADMRAALKSFPMDLKIGEANLARAYKSGVILVTGSDAGNLLVFHGPTVHHELQLWRQAGIPATVALQAATYNAARLLHAEKRIGSIRKGLDADLLIVDGNPLEDIQMTERISLVMSKGERIDRSELFEQK